MHLAGPALTHLQPVILCCQTSRLCWSPARSLAKLAHDYHFPDPRDALWLTIVLPALHPAIRKPLPLPQRHFSCPRCASQVIRFHFYVVIQRVTSATSALLSGNSPLLCDNSAHLSGVDPKQIRRAMQRVSDYPKRLLAEKDK